MELTPIKAGLSADSVNAAFNTVVQAKYDGVFVPAIQPSLWKRGLEQLDAAGIPVTTAGVVGVDTSKVAMSQVSDTTIERTAKLAASYVVAQQGDETDVVFYVTPEVAFNPVLEKAFTAEVERLCPACKTRSEKVPAAALGTQAPTIISDDLQAHPRHHRGGLRPVRGHRRPAPGAEDRRDQRGPAEDGHLPRPLHPAADQGRAGRRGPGLRRPRGRLDRDGLPGPPDHRPAGGPGGEGRSSPRSSSSPRRSWPTRTSAAGGWPTPTSPSASPRCGRRPRERAAGRAGPVQDLPRRQGPGRGRPAGARRPGGGPAGPQRLGQVHPHQGPRRGAPRRLRLGAGGPGGGGALHPPGPRPDPHPERAGEPRPLAPPGRRRAGAGGPPRRAGQGHWPCSAASAPPSTWTCRWRG